VRALGQAGIRSLVLGPDRDRLRHSRFAVRAAAGGAGPPLEVLDRIAQVAGDRPVVFTDCDETLVELSAGRDRLTGAFRYLMPAHDLVLDLTDKGRFQRLAERLDLPVPAGRNVSPEREDPDGLELEFPLVLKPVPFRNDRWRAAFGGGAKALRVDNRARLVDLWPLLASTGLDFMAQAMVAGDETHIVSYHAYVDSDGEVAGEFTGRKIRTHPAEFGMSCALITTEDEPLARAGRELVARLGLVGPAKLDFKRDATGRPHLLEVNPRFTLWAHPGAVAGVNLPAIAWADLTGAPRPRMRTARPGVRWIKPRDDLAAARASGVPLMRWLPWAIRCESNQAFAWNDPAPAIRHRIAH
jgi:predicted ATP-grasp superfamily ATP-dependent carboligase